MATHARPSAGHTEPVHETSPVDRRSDRRTVQLLLAGDETAFSQLINTLHGPLLRLALTFVDDRAIAEEIVQETWIGVLRGLSHFDGRASLKTWIFHILMNQARTRFRQEHQAVWVSLDEDTSGPTVDPAQFCPGTWPEQWCALPQFWNKDTPEQLLLSREGRQRIEQAIRQLPFPQRLVITLRDIDDVTADEVCHLLHISEANQRVLLHRARAHVRRALEAYFKQDRETANE